MKNMLQPLIIGNGLALPLLSSAAGTYARATRQALLSDVMQVALARRKYPREKALLDDLSSRLDKWK